MIGHFKENGKKYVVDTPKTPRHWTNRIFNDKYVLELNQMMQGTSRTFLGFHTTEWIKSERHFYIRDIETGEVFCPLYTPLNTPLDKFESEYGLGYHRVTSEKKGIETEITAFVPTEGFQEFWKVKVKNNTDAEKKLSLFSVFSLEDLSFMGSNACYDKATNCIYKHAYPGYSLYNEKEKLDNTLKYVYMHCNREPDSYDTNKYRFYGCDDQHDMPKAVTDGTCQNTVTQGMESIIGGMEHKLALATGAEIEICFTLGVAVHKEDVKKEIEVDIDAEWQKMEALWDKRCNNFTVNTENDDLNALVNYWFKKQVTYLSRTNRLDVSSPVRNELQDTMGYAFAEPYEALEIMKRVLKRQYLSGYIKQWNIHDGSGDRGLALLRHSDAPLWIAVCFIEVISHIIKDNSRYDDLVGYIDGDEEESIREHIRKALYFMSDENELGEHGLCLMRDGDWTDPMNGVGYMGKGESVWNSMVLVYSINEFIKLFDDKELENRAKLMKEKINEHAWDGEWYLAALDDRGRKVGTHEDEEGKIFLNTQTWAVISGVAEGERLEKVIKSMETLKTMCGYKLSDPPFSKWNEKWGKISVKQMGALENGAVYCHGTLFKAFGDYLIGDIDASMETILASLPTNPENPSEINMQLPLYMPNYYFGVENENFGRSSCFYNTGTTSWIMVILNRIYGGDE